MAYHRELKREFPYFDEREDAILVQRLKNDELIWSPKELWEFDYKPPELSAEPEIVPVELWKIRVRDEDVFWEFKVTEVELQMLKSGKLELFWNQGWIERDTDRRNERNKVTEWRNELHVLQESGVGLFIIQKHEIQFRRQLRKLIKKEEKKVVYREWCLVTKKQRELLLNRTNYTKNYRQLVKEGGSEAWSEWSSIRWLKHGPTWREYKRITRTPLRKSQLTIEKKSDPDAEHLQKGEEYRPKFIKRFKKR